MNKISLIKQKTIPRHCLVHHYKMGRPISKPNVGVVSKPQNINVNPVPKVVTTRRSTKPNIKPNVKIVSIKSTALKQTKRNNIFDSRTSKVKSIQGIGKGKILVILAPGPSILQIEIKRLMGIKNIDTMTINKPDSRLWPSSYWMFCDRTQYTRNKEVFHRYPNTIINTDSIKAQHPKQIHIKNLSGKGFSTDMIKGFYIGRSTTFSAMQVAAWMDYNKIFILGLDMCRIDGKLHSYGVNPDVPEKIREGRFKQEAEFYNVAAKIMNEELRNKFYICSSYNPWPFVDKFHRINQKEAVEYILNEQQRINSKIN